MYIYIIYNIHIYIYIYMYVYVYVYKSLKREIPSYMDMQNLTSYVLEHSIAWGLKRIQSILSLC